MIEQVDFYILGNVDKIAKLKFACRIAQKAYAQGLKVYLQTESRQQSEELDALMWTFSQASFVPHTLSDDIGNCWESYPVQLGSVLESNKDADVLVSLIEDIPKACAQFRRIVDLITDSPSEKASGRKRYRHYRSLGIEPNTHLIA